MESILSSDRFTAVDLSPGEYQRYARHLTIPDIGPDGQRKLKAARILCIGAGGLGSPATLYLAAAGIGEIGIVDFDQVDFSNLQRQILHDTADVGKLKTESALERLRAINPETRITPYETRLTSENAIEIAAPYDVILDGTDNFETRYLSNDLAVLTKKPNVYGSIYRFEGQVSVFAPHLGGPCYRCLFPRPPEPGQIPSCAEGGVLGVLPGIVGSLQANEVIKLILGLGDPLIGRLLHFDALAIRFREIKLRRDPRCAICGEDPSLTELHDISFACDMSPSPDLPEIDVHQLKSRFEEDTPFVLLDVREPAEIEICRLPGAVVIPLGELPERLGELDPSAETIIHCKAGVRSAKALQILLEAGFENACHLQGGINAWSTEIDPSVPLY
ncbi:MAG: molybdopterin-synthase adenylyltransferase MoeB [Verrucomicrobiaceae bacterium]|nr:molybdopterin-synthase adenylyltransferase MoeB [Verrucomicrobiaceae bacterium]